MLPEQSLEKDILRMAARSQQSRLDNPRPEGLAPGTKGPSIFFEIHQLCLSIMPVGRRSLVTACRE